MAQQREGFCLDGFFTELKQALGKDKGPLYRLTAIATDIVACARNREETVTKGKSYIIRHATAYKDGSAMFYWGGQLFPYIAYAYLITRQTTLPDGKATSCRYLGALNTLYKTEHGGNTLKFYGNIPPGQCHVFACEFIAASPTDAPGRDALPFIHRNVKEALIIACNAELVKTLCEQIRKDASEKIAMWTRTQETHNQVDSDLRNIWGMTYGAPNKPSNKFAAFSASAGDKIASLKERTASLPY